MKKEAKSKKMTIDKLAIMMNNGFERLDKKIDKEVGDVKKNVSSNTKVSNLILKEISAIHEDNKRFRETVASLNMDSISYNRRIENLTIRVEKLEIKN
jgi:hypothetical protein